MNPAQPANDDRSGTPADPERRCIGTGLAALWKAKPADRYFDVLIVGSGYGGSVAAARLAGRCDAETGLPLRIGLLERGNEFLPGQFPSRFSEAPKQLRVALQNSGIVRGQHDGLYDVRLGDDVAALVANGLGGGSLINAGVLLEPDPANVQGDPHLIDLIQQLRAGNYFDQARRELGGQVRRGQAWLDNTIDRHPDGPALAKSAALKTLAGGARFEKPRVSVAMDDGPNSAGVCLTQCSLCGDCMTGCNVGAKDSLDANLLERAARGKVEIYTGASVISVVRSKVDAPPTRWGVRVRHTDPALQERETDVLMLYARRVILAAGTLGSPEILMRSRSSDLIFSPRLGEGFSCNGDNIAAVHRMAEPTHACADEDKHIGGRKVGPTITASFSQPYGDEVPAAQFLVQEFAVPGPLKQLFEEIVTTTHVLAQMPECDPRPHGQETPNVTADPLAVDPDAMGRTLLVGVIGHDDAGGTLHLPRPLRPRSKPAEPGTIRIRWPDARHSSRLDGAQAELARRVGELQPGAEDRPELLANPMWQLLPQELADLVTQPRGPVLTVHPLGGCPIGKRARKGDARDRTQMRPGVVDDCGRVFMASLPKGWRGSLVVLDGSIMPGSLGVNPALTITATAMRAMDRLCGDWGYVPGPPQTQPITVRRRVGANPVTEPPVPPPTRTAVEIAERLRGEVMLRLGGEPEPKSFIVELTLAYKTKELLQLMHKFGSSLVVDCANPLTRLRIYDAGQWHGEQLPLRNEDERERCALIVAELDGELRFLHREASTSWWRSLRGTWAWLLNRGTRDICQASCDGGSLKKGLGHYALSLLKQGTRAGEVRRFDYELRLGQILRCSLHGASEFQPGAPVSGFKRLTYNRRANPWRQLSELSLSRMPGLSQRGPVLKLDTRFIVGQGYPLLRIACQQDHAQALLDLFSFCLYLARVFVNVHLWTFRKPDEPRRAEPDRLPREVPGTDGPEVTELVVDRMPVEGDDAIHVRGSSNDLDSPRRLISVCNDLPEVPVKIRLSRYRPTQGLKPELRPLVMIHGYSVSGNTFTHESLKPSAVEYFCSTGREVWVVDLRTSAALDSARQPWAMEQAGLIDIPAALLHIRNATQSRVDVLAHCIGCVMLSMAVLADAGEVAADVTQLGVGTWLTSEQLGTLNAFNGVCRTGKRPHPCIARIVLSQKGPLLRYTDSNVLRAFVLQSMRRWLLADDYQFRPPRDPKVSDQLLDRFLSSVPYPDEDYDVENPLRPCAKRSWTATRHRMDALYGRDFNAANLSEATLDAIDDLFGPINLDTVSQTIHFTRFNVITNQRGRGEFVTRRRLRERWGGIPTLALHGRDNGLVDASTQYLLTQQFLGAEVPFRALDIDKPPYSQLGHQDVLLGTQSGQVFKDIDAFLRDDDIARPGKPPSGVVIAVPWIGPRIDLPDDTGQTLRLGCMSRPDQGQSRLLLVPAVQQGNGSFGLADGPARPLVGVEGGSDDWLYATPDLSSLGRLPAPTARGVLGYLALLWYERDEVGLANDPEWFTPLGSRPRAAAAGSGPASPSVARPGNVEFSSLGDVPFSHHFDWGRQHLVLEHDEPAHLLAQLRGDEGALIDPQTWLKLSEWVTAQAPALIGPAFVRLDDLQRIEALRRCDEPCEGFRFAVASCQYPAGLVDAKLAAISLATLGRARERDETSVDLAVFLGDQIYADATAGLMDPTRRDERFDMPHEKAFRQDGMRLVLRRLPTRMLLDDHEIVDNYEPLPGKVERRRPFDALDRRLRMNYGYAAWRKYQRMRTKNELWPRAYGPADMELRHGGHDFYFADTRTGRRSRGSSSPDYDILSDEQFRALEGWLARIDGGPGARVKFVSTPSLLLPRRFRSATDPAGADYSDAWDGYPRSLERLLALILDKRHLDVVFLSGDEHHSMYAEILVWRHGAAPCSAVKIVSVHSSALYAPFPFANGQQRDLQKSERFTLGQLQVDVSTRFASPGDGYARLGVAYGGASGPVLNVEFVRDGVAGQLFPVPLRDKPKSN